jgi:hypothetical protein
MDETHLLLQQAGMAGHALPAGVLEDPGIGEASHVLVRPALIGPFGMVDAGDYGSVLVKHNLDILNVQQTDLELWISDIGEKFPSFAELPIPFGVDEFVADHGGERAGVAAHLSFVPQMFESDKLLFARMGIITRRLRQDQYP